MEMECDRNGKWKERSCLQFSTDVWWKTISNDGTKDGWSTQEFAFSLLSFVFDLLMSKISFWLKVSGKEKAQWNSLDEYLETLIEEGNITKDKKWASCQTSLDFS